jgi:hypothetical protein
VTAAIIATKNGVANTVLAKPVLARFLEVFTGRCQLVEENWIVRLFAVSEIYMTCICVG